MRRKQLGRTGLQVSELCFGTMSFGGDADEATSAALYAACRDAGINFFDCANVYSAGAAETILGGLIAGHREEVIITSKCFGRMSYDPNSGGGNRRAIIQSVEDSLKRLRTDRIDVQFMHQWDPTVPIEETLRALDSLVQAGKILYLGASNYAAWQIATALGVSDRHGWPRLDVIQPMYSLAKRQAESEILPLAEAEDLAVISYGPVGGGLLSGKYKPDVRPNSGRLLENKEYARRYRSDEYYQIAAQFTDLASELNVHPVSLAVAWAATHPAITCPIIGARNVAQLAASLAAPSVDMNPERRRQISQLSAAPAPAHDRSEIVPSG